MLDYAKLGLPSHYTDKFHLFDLVGECMNIFIAILITAIALWLLAMGMPVNVKHEREGGDWMLLFRITTGSWGGFVNGIDDTEWNPELDPCLESDGYHNLFSWHLTSWQTCKQGCASEEAGVACVQWGAIDWVHSASWLSEGHGLVSRGNAMDDGPRFAAGDAGYRLQRPGRYVASLWRLLLW